MEEHVELVDAEEALAFLKRFPEDSQVRGQKRYREGAVQSVSPIEAGTHYIVTVNDGTWENRVELLQDPHSGWSGSCTCPAQADCAHIFAAMSALLAENRMTLVRKLSRGESTGEAKKAGQLVTAPVFEEETMAERLVKATGARLSREATAFLNKLHTLYTRWRQTQSLTYWDLQQLGLVQPHYSWALLDIWPNKPRNEHEFWLYIANYLQQQGSHIPEFMEPVSDLAPIADRLLHWQRAREIEKWKQLLGTWHPERAQAATQKTELRVVITEYTAQLEWLPPGKGQFEKAKQNQLRRLQDSYYEGQLQLDPQSELIWQLFSNASDYGSPIDIDYEDPDSTQVLNRLIRVPALENRIVTSKGQPFARETEMLRWELRPAQSDDDDYLLRLVRADGSPVPPVWVALHGHPVLYVTDGVIFPGPASAEGVLNPAKENRIPAPAVERAGGLSFLQALGLELPERVRDRVRTLQYKVTIDCGLRPIFPGSDTEECFITVSADAPNGQVQEWDGFSWRQKKAGQSGKKSAGGKAITIYDESALKELPSVLEPLGLKPSRYQRGLSMRLTRKFADVFVSWLTTVPSHITVNLEGELASLTSGDVAGRVKLEVTESEIDWFDLQVVLDVADTTLTQAEIKLLLNAKGSFVRLQGKGWRRLQYDLTQEESDRLARLGVSPKEFSAEPQRLHALQLADDAAKKFLPDRQVEQIQRRAAEIKARVAPPLPTGIKAKLRPYQLEGFHFLAYLSANRFGGILADDMGLGKTLQTLAWLVWLREQNLDGSQSENGEAPGAPPSLVVCPKSVMDNWRAEAERFAPGLRVKAWPAGEVAQVKDQLGIADIHVINYNQLRLLGESLVSVHWLALVLDEGQYIKNPNSQTAQVARALKAGHRLVLSGTPIENRLMDLWSLMAFTMPGVLGSRTQFARLYDAKGDPLARKRLAARVRPFLLRRTKTQVAKDLPDRVEEDLFCEIEGEQQTLYRAELKAAQQLLLSIKTQKELAQQQFHFLTSLLRLRQICCHPRLIQPESKAPSAKCESLLEQLEPLMEEGHKVLVFSQFVQMLDLLRPSIEERKWPLFYLAGQTENRGELVQRFQSEQGSAVFLISLKAGGFGLNLTAASYVVLFDPWWNPAVENQAIDRTHRIGQTNKVIAYRLLIKNSIEEKIRELQKQKRALVDDVFGEEKFAQSLTIEDLRFLFADSK
ncbi:MAG TPA: DEAD/DEAH box helicase [Verrucomicrobiae bacterium]|nr:DEAD/DEAH box helicase [Verrucomicrobiae bacterium]